MEINFIREEISPVIAELPADGAGVRRWHAPVLQVFEMSGAKADPLTSGDDGLGNGS